jgi:membrane protease YdiL (CAAX protease family)
MANLADLWRGHPEQSKRQQGQVAGGLVFGLILMLNVFIMTYPLLAILSVQTSGTTDLSRTNAVLAVLMGWVIGGFGLLLLIKPTRRFLWAFFPKRQAYPAPSLSAFSPILADGEPDFSPPPLPSAQEGRGFDPQSLVHLSGLILTLHFMAFQIMSFFLADGMAGLAEDIAINEGVLIANFLPQIILPFLGVGFLIRRSWRQTFKRLGLKGLRWRDVAVSFVATFFLLMMVLVVAGLWQATVSAETFERQTQASRALSESINTLTLAFLVAFTAGVGEEIAFRGALQPVFGFWFTTVVFVLSHSQYTLTPATLIIFVVAMAFGILRHYFSTTVAILTHFLYNFAMLALPFIAGESIWLYWWLG